jgi:4-hydroxy-2-oxoheptanedioate aldolase
LLEARRWVVEAALAHGKYAGTVALPENLRELIRLGYRFLNIGADVLGLFQYCKSTIAEFAQAASGIRSNDGRKDS